METTLYDDSFRFGSTSLKTMKRPVTLDLDSPDLASKKQRLATVLTSPDLNMLKLSSPELERFIMTQNGTITTTPTPTQFRTITPTQFFFPKNVTEEQEKYAKGFVDILARLHQSSSNDAPYVQIAELSSLVPTTTSQTTTTFQVTTAPSAAKVARPPSVESSSSNSMPSDFSSFSLAGSYVKEELQTVPSSSSPPVSPINLEDQERIKLERKRYRNRIAASKCRRRKLERIAKLEKKVQELKDENSELSTFASRLREQVCNLKQEVLDHAKQGCQIMVTHAY